MRDAAHSLRDQCDNEQPEPDDDADRDRPQGQSSRLTTTRGIEAALRRPLPPVPGDEPDQAQPEGESDAEGVEAGTDRPEAQPDDDGEAGHEGNRRHPRSDDLGDRAPSTGPRSTDRQRCHRSSGTKSIVPVAYEGGQTNA